jgi:radical SAM protein with 4Fe4S-binding SPASM domain
LTLVQTATYGQFSSLLHERFQGRRVPVEVSIEVTHRCPLECQHCYNNLPMGDQNARQREMTFDEHVCLLDQLTEAGCLWLLYTGGEIFARKDFLDIYTEAKKRGFLITLFTNGTLISPRIADYLVQYPPLAIEITLYGATRETYEELTRIPGSFDRCMRGIRLLRERGLPLKLKTVPTTVNFHQVYEMKRFAEQEIGVEFKFDPLVNPRTDCSQSPLAVRLSPEQAVTLDFHDPVRRAEFARLAQREQAANYPVSKKRYTCGAGQNGCAIDPNGRMTMCVLSHRDGYDLRSGSFEEGWNGRIKDLRASSTMRETICTHCHIRSLCSMCPANGELEAGNAESPVEFLCQVAHLRAIALGIEIPAHGDCDCCAGGRHHQALREAAERINQNSSAPGKLVPFPTPANPLPVLNSSEGCASGGCSSCGGHSH